MDGRQRVASVNAFDVLAIGLLIGLLVHAALIAIMFDRQRKRMDIPLSLDMRDPIAEYDWLQEEMEQEHSNDEEVEAEWQQVELQ